MAPYRTTQVLFTPEMVNLMTEIDGFRERWTTTQTLAPDRLAALRQVATIESIGSSTRIEGVKLTNSEIEALLRGVKTYSFRSRDEQEVAGYAEVMELIFSSHRDMPLTENHIKQLHRSLLKYSTKDERHRGEYKKFPNHVGAFGPDGKSLGIIFQTALPFDTPRLMTELVEWTNTQLTLRELHPLFVIAVFTVVFLQIHPFQDGNGRLSRALTTLLLLRHGYSYVPYSSMERVIEENKDAYYLALRKAQAELDVLKSPTPTQSAEHSKARKDRGPNTAEKGLGGWIVFFLRSMQKQKAALESKLANELLLTRLPRLSQQIIELIKDRGPTSVAEVVAVTGANRNTVKVHFRGLVNDGHLVVDGKGRGVRYRIDMTHGSPKGEGFTHPKGGTLNGRPRSKPR
jgi:Fic family protein